MAFSRGKLALQLPEILSSRGEGEKKPYELPRTLVGGGCPAFTDQKTPEQKLDVGIRCQPRGCSHHQAYWGLAKALKTEGAVLTPALRKSDKSVTLDDWEKAECLADSIEQQCSENPPHDLKHVHRVEKEVHHRVSFHPKTI
ncbi:hypothetical protein EVAR_95503_1 [Eumeta japonica]|uniref:Uncharacterized protein n=1 Tax=Eumeta variegata TaxID=151549 RepID=A0A4C1UK27_EUMVA|nr:hypothetical protein EVAR_95503_1 [Eumeta japonica]